MTTQLEKQMIQKVQTPYGTMKFKSARAADDFYCTIRTWREFHTRPEGWRALPISLEEAVTYHLAYTTGGFEEVEKVFAICTASSHKADVARAQADAERRAASETRYAIASLAPRDSALYREHFDMSYPGYKWGW